MIHCPFCQHNSSIVLETRDHSEGLRRKRKCDACGEKFDTIEACIKQLPLIIKKDGRREAFNPQKLKQSLLIALRKRSVSSLQIEQMLQTIEQQLLNYQDKEIKAYQLGLMAMQALKQLDEVAYIRFASVYQNVQSLQEFTNLIASIDAQNNELK